MLAMLVLIVAATGLWIQRSMFASGQRPPQEVFLAAAAQARILAMQSGKPVLLSFDEQAQGFRLQMPDADNPMEHLAVADVPWLDEGGTAWAGVQTLSAAQRDLGAGSLAPAAASGEAVSRFYPLGEGARLRVTFYLLYGENAEVLPDPLAAIRYHPSGVSTPVQVQIQEGGASGFSQILLPDNLANGLRLDERGNVFTGSNVVGGRR